MKPWRWALLSKKEKRICRLLVVKRMKRRAAGQEVGLSLTRTGYILEAIYRTMGVEDMVELAFEMGKHWKAIQ